MMELSVSSNILLSNVGTPFVSFFYSLNIFLKIALLLSVKERFLLSFAGDAGVPS